jgi:hypothetical protein
MPKELQDSTTGSEYRHKTSMAFNIKTKQKLWCWDINGFSDELKPGDLRFDSPNSPQVVDFIRAHKHLVNPCFLELAKKSNLRVD